MNNPHNHLQIIPNLDEIAGDPSKAELLSYQDIWDLMVRVNGLQSILLGRLACLSQSVSKSSLQGDQLLDVNETAKKLSVSKDWLYRNSNKLPFTRRLGPRKLRFSDRGIEKYIKSRQNH